MTLLTSALLCLEEPAYKLAVRNGKIMGLLTRKGCQIRVVSSISGRLPVKLNRLGGLRCSRGISNLEGIRM